MKKIFVMAAALLGLAALTSCCNCDGDKSKKCPPCDKPCCEAPGCGNPEMGVPCPPAGVEPGGCCKPEGPKCELAEKWTKFDSLSQEEQKALIAATKAKIDEREAAMKAAREDFEKKWADFDNLSIDEQKKLIEMKLQCGKHHGKPGCDGQKPGCNGPRPDAPKPAPAR